MVVIANGEPVEVSADATVGEVGTVLRDSLGRWHFPLW